MIASKRYRRRNRNRHANHSEVRTTAFAYVPSGGGKGELATLTYPSGAVLTHQYNATSRLSGMLWNGQPLVENLQYNALGQPLSWSWAFGQPSGPRLPAQRLYNTAGQLTSSEFASFAPETTGRIWLPTASGPMPVAAVINGTHYAVHADHLNTPRRLSDSAGQTRWQWPYSGFGEINPQSTPAAGQPAISYALRYPGQIDDGNGLFYNWHRFYDPRVGRYTKADPIGLEGGWNRFGYVGGNPISGVDPKGLMGGGNGAAHKKGPPTIGPFGCVGIMCMSATPLDNEPQLSIDPTLGGGIEICDPPQSPPPPQTCKKSCGIYDPSCNNSLQPPAVPVPKLGNLTLGAFIAPSIKADGRFCVRLGVFASPPINGLPFFMNFLPSVDLGGWSE